MHLPPLAYSITRYKVFSVSITSKSLTAGGKRKAKQEEWRRREWWGKGIRREQREKQSKEQEWKQKGIKKPKTNSRINIIWLHGLKNTGSQQVTTHLNLMFQGDSPMLGWFNIFMILTSRKSCEKRDRPSNTPSDCRGSCSCCDTHLYGHFSSVNVYHLIMCICSKWQGAKTNASIVISVWLQRLQSLCLW